MKEMIVEIDPHLKHSRNRSVEERRNILHTCGLIPGWILDADADDSEETFQEIFARKYPFGTHTSTGATVDERGCMLYPGDPDMHPLLKIQRNGETMYQYEYAMVAVVQDNTGESWVTRMD